MEVQNKNAQIDPPYWICTPPIDEVPKLIGWCDLSTSLKSRFLGAVEIAPDTQISLHNLKSHLHIHLTIKLDAFGVNVALNKNSTLMGMTFLKTGDIQTISSRRIDQTTVRHVYSTYSTKFAKVGLQWLHVELREWQPNKLKN